MRDPACPCRLLESEWPPDLAGPHPQASHQPIGAHRVAAHESWRTWRVWNRLPAHIRRRLREPERKLRPRVVGSSRRGRQRARELHGRSPARFTARTGSSAGRSPGEADVHPGAKGLHVRMLAPESRPLAVPGFKEHGTGHGANPGRHWRLQAHLYGLLIRHFHRRVVCASVSDARARDGSRRSGPG